MRVLRRVAIAMLVVGCAIVAAGGSSFAVTGAATPAFAFAHPATPAALVAPGRVFAAAAGSSDGTSVVVYGGQTPNSNNVYGDTWVNGADETWKPKCGTTVAGATTPCGPGSRDGLGMADAHGGVILYGGFAGDLGNAPSGDTWRWNGATWTRVCTTATCGPGTRGLMAMAGNGTTAVMFGGIGGSGLTSDTWVFDGNTWTRACGQPGAPCGPAALAAASMAWDGTNFVLFGGVDLGGSSAPVDDTWLFNGHRWNKICGTSMSKPCGPAARGLGAFAYAPNPTSALQGAILAGGGDLFGSGATQSLYRDAWFFDGTRWTRLDPPWNGSTVTFPSNGSPPAGPDPLLGVMAPKTARCETVYLGTFVKTAGNPPTLDETTFSAGRSPWTPTKPNCTAAVVPTTQPTTTTTSQAAEPALVSTPPTTVATLPKTGSSAPAASIALGLLLVALGALLLGAADRRRAT